MREISVMISLKEVLRAADELALNGCDGIMVRATEVRSGERSPYPPPPVNSIFDDSKNDGKFIGPDAKPDNVNHPSHYASGKIEVIEAIEDWCLGFSLGNAIKYIARSGKKDAGKDVEDLEKAVWYIRRRIEILKAEKEKRPVTRPNDMVKK